MTIGAEIAAPSTRPATTTIHTSVASPNTTNGRAPRPVLDQERHQHLERAHHREDHQAGEQQRGEQPRVRTM